MIEKIHSNHIVENDFSMTFSTVNGSGSATANNTILRSIFNMGIPVSARNIFPSNIQGMPTWYSMRVSKSGYLGSREKYEILIAMNKETVEIDLDNLCGNGLFLYRDDLKIEKKRLDISQFALPVDELVESCGYSSNLNVYLANMVYVGVLAFLINIDVGYLESSLDHHFGGKKSAIEPNFNVIKTSFAWAEKKIKIRSRFQLKPLNKTKDKIMIDGNTAAAMGALYGGLQFAAWYPITPATSLAESLNDYIPQLRTDPDTNEISCVVVQAEDELAAIGMVVGAGWAGLRSMTSTSGPGLCLMSEFLGLAYFTEVPLVVWDVQRVGPSTGMPTHTSQSDLSFSYFISHGDKDFVILLPSNINECFEFGWKALDIANELQTPVIVLSDLELGMNIWMADQFEYPDKEIKQGKILWEKDLDEFTKRFKREWGRYLDVDGDGITYRTVPGNMNPRAPYFTRGTSHDNYAHYSEKPDDWEQNLRRLKKKISLAKELIPEPEVFQTSKKNAMISYGTTDMPAREAVDKLGAHHFDYMKIRAIPFNKQVDKFVENHEKIFIVENNRDGQLSQILCLNYPDHASKFISISRSNGMSLSAAWIEEKVVSYLHKGKINE